MRRFRPVLLALACIAVLVAPVSAQSAQSAPGSGDVTPAVLLGAVVLVIVAVIGFFGTIGKSYVDNLFDKAKTERKEEVQEKENLTELIKAIVTLGTGMSDQATTAAQDRADASRDRKTLLDIVETKDSAAAGRKDSITKINEHTEEVVEPVVKVIETAAKDIREAVVNVPTMEQFKKELANQLDPILDQLTEFGAYFAALVKKDNASMPTAPLVSVNVNGNSTPAQDTPPAPIE